MQSKKGNAVAWVLVIVVVVLLGWWFAAHRGNDTNIQINATSSDTTGTVTAPATTTGGVAHKTVTVTYTASGFTPASVTINKGDSVTWVNQSGHDMWIGSAMHPTHIVYSGTSLSQHCATGVNDSFDECKNGDTYSFTFDKVGSWGYHNHSRASDTGKVIVQ